VKERLVICNEEDTDGQARVLKLLHPNAFKASLMVIPGNFVTSINYKKTRMLGL